MALSQDTTNTATVTAKDPLNGNVTDTDTAFVDVLITGLQIDKTAPPIIRGNGPVTYTYTVQNTGSDPINTVKVVRQFLLAGHRSGLHPGR